MVAAGHPPARGEAAGRRAVRTAPLRASPQPSPARPLAPHQLATHVLEEGRRGLAAVRQQPVHAWRGGGAWQRHGAWAFAGLGSEPRGRRAAPFDHASTPRQSVGALCSRRTALVQQLGAVQLLGQLGHLWSQRGSRRTRGVHGCCEAPAHLASPGGPVLAPAQSWRAAAARPSKPCIHLDPRHGLGAVLARDVLQGVASAGSDRWRSAGPLAVGQRGQPAAGQAAAAAASARPAGPARPTRPAPHRRARLQHTQHRTLAVCVVNVKLFEL